MGDYVIHVRVLRRAQERAARGPPSAWATHTCSVISRLEGPGPRAPSGKTLSGPGGHAWPPLAAVPGAWPSGSPFTPPPSPGVTRVARCGPPTPDAVPARPGAAGPPRRGEPWQPNLPAPATGPRAPEARRSLGLVSRLSVQRRGLEVRTCPRPPSPPPGPRRLSSRTRPAAGWPPGRAQTPRAPQRRCRAARGIPAAGAGGRRGDRKGPGAASSAPPRPPAGDGGRGGPPEWRRPGGGAS